MEKARIGIIGAGNIAREHLGAFTEAPHAVLAGICDKVEERAAELSRIHDIPLFKDSQSMLQSADIDAVVLAVPNYQHAPLCMMAPWQTHSVRETHGFEC